MPSAGLCVVTALPPLSGRGPPHPVANSASANPTLLDRFLALELCEQCHRMDRLSGMLQVMVDEIHAHSVAEKVLVPLTHNLPNLVAAPKGEGRQIGTHSRREDSRAHWPPQRSEGFGRDFKRHPGKHLFAHDHVHLQPHLGGPWRIGILPTRPTGTNGRGGAS